MEVAISRDSAMKFFDKYVTLHPPPATESKGSTTKTKEVKAVFSSDSKQDDRGIVAKTHITAWSVVGTTQKLITVKKAPKGSEWEGLETPNLATALASLIACQSPAAFRLLPCFLKLYPRRISDIKTLTEVLEDQDALAGWIMEVFISNSVSPIDE